MTELYRHRRKGGIGGGGEGYNVNNVLKLLHKTARSNELAGQKVWQPVEEAQGKKIHKHALSPFASCKQSRSQSHWVDWPCLQVSSIYAMDQKFVFTFPALAVSLFLCEAPDQSRCLTGCLFRQPIVVQTAAVYKKVWTADECTFICMKGKYLDWIWWPNRAVIWDFNACTISIESFRLQTECTETAHEIAYMCVQCNI